MLSGSHTAFPLQVASWLTFLALLVTPGYLLGELATWRLRLDSIERLALAFPLSIVVLAVPGMIALLRHQTIVELANGWISRQPLSWYLVCAAIDTAQAVGPRRTLDRGSTRLGWP